MGFPESFTQECEALARRLLGAPAPSLPADPRLQEAMLYSLLTPGKRLRPRLLMAVGEKLGLDSEATLPAACALEFFHCATLIHDDLPCMDDDDERRGQPANHRKFGEAMALLAGDALIILAPQALLECSARVAPGRVLEAMRILLEAMGAAGVMSGQATELGLAPGQAAPRATLERLHAQKTGALFSAALGIPAALAGLAQAEIARLRAIGDGIGFAFQLIDDLLDADQDREARHKSILSHLSPAETQTLARARLNQARRELGSTPALDALFAQIEGALL